MGGLSAAAMEWAESRGLDLEILDRLGVFSENAGGEEEVIGYPTSRDGQRVGCKYRPLKPRDGGQRFWRKPGDKIVGYNEDCLRDPELFGKPLVIVEGYEDCISVIQSGFPKCLSVPDGAPQSALGDGDSAKYAWLSEIMPLLSYERVPEVILFTDGDGPGAALREDLSHRIGRSRCKFCIFPKAPDPQALGRERLKDANEILIVFKEKGVRQTIERATWLDTNGVYSLRQLPEAPPPVILHPGFDALSEHLRLRLGDLMVLSGVPGLGKTTFVTDLVCRVVDRYDLRAGWASFEQDPIRDHRRYLRSWFCEEAERNLTQEQKWSADEWIEKHHRFVVPADTEDPTLEWLLDKFEIAVIQHGCKLLIVDPWNEATHERSSGETETDYTNRSLRTFNRFCRRFGVFMIIVAHPTKLQRLQSGAYPCPTLYDISGSAAWKNKCSLGVIVHKPDEHSTLIKVEKSKHWEEIGRPGIVRMEFLPSSRRYVETERNVIELDPDQPLRRRRTSGIG